ncbi:MAG TPA: dihydropteroate synthase [Saprospiraceae bacterium]|nr:dihydropteroate synthase [Saprospiraceae bacterium]
MLISQTLTPLRCGNHLLNLSFPMVAGIINVTPDSFFEPSRTLKNDQKAIDLASKMVEEGAQILDIGGMSSRPGAKEISISEEEDRVLPVIENLASLFPSIVISVDTYRSEVAKQAIKAGATMVNDISGGSLDEGMFDVIASHHVAYVLMHMRGNPSNMQNLTDYQDVISDLLKYFVNKLQELHHSGIRDIIIDPGFGFSKTMEQNYQVIDQLEIFRLLGYPIMVGLSRKSTLSKTVGQPVEETLNATTALHMAALINGASLLRVHDVKPAIETIAVYKKLREAKSH